MASSYSFGDKACWLGISDSFLVFSISILQSHHLKFGLAFDLLAYCIVTLDGCVSKFTYRSLFGSKATLSLLQVSRQQVV